MRKSVITVMVWMCPRVMSLWREPVIKNQSLLMALLATALSVGVHAQEMQLQPVAGWYGAANAGQSKVKIDDLDLASLDATGSESKDETDTAWRLAIGYQFNPYLAVEGGYVDFGRFKQEATITAPVSGSFSGDIEARGWFIDAVGTYPLGAKVSVLGRVGTVRSTTKTSFSTGGGLSGALAAAGIDSSPSASEWNWRYGLGLQFDFTRSLALRLEYDQTRNVGKEDTTGEGNIDVWSLGVVLRF
jgi:OOP family OmpA-OmpF porin